MLRYVRRQTRNPYEKVLVDALAALGYEISLSTDAEDELVGIDAWIVTDLGTIPIDFYVGDNPGVLNEKLEKAQLYGTLVVNLPWELNPNLRRLDDDSLLQIMEILETALREAKGRQFKTPFQAREYCRRRLEYMYHYENSARVRLER